MTQATLSFNMSSSEISIAHNNRTIPVPHSDIERQGDNYYWSGNKSLEQAYTELFSADVQEYNAGQKRKDRKIENYLEKITDSFEREKEKLRKLRGQGATRKTIRQNQKAVKPCYEFIVTVGNMHDNPEFNSVNGERKYEIRELLKRYVDDFAKRYNGKGYGIELFNGSIHLCENGQVHLHCDIIFHSNDNNRGMKHQVSLNKGLAQLGFCGDNKKLPITQWEEYERSILSEMCAEHGIEIISGKGSKKHLHKEQYIIEQEKQNLERKKEEFSDLLFQTETGNTFLVMQENDDLREEVAALQEQSKTENARLAQLWEKYKKENSQYWERYNEHKRVLLKEIDQVQRQNKIDRERLNSLFNSVINDNGFILFRLVRFFSALYLKFKIDREEYLLKELREFHMELKESARTICSMSQKTAETLKSKEFDKIYQTIADWEFNLHTINITLERQFESIAPEREEQER